MLHQELMELVDQAVVARQRGDVSAILGLARAAFEKERAAADLVAMQFDLEPTRSVLHRSAAVLALECSELREAERLIGRALAGNPPADIADELRDLLLEEIYSQRQAIGLWCSFLWSSDGIIQSINLCSKSMNLKL